MGGRGSKSSQGKGGRGGVVDNGTPKLDEELKRRANAAGTFVDYGDSAQRNYDRFVSEIQGFDLTADEKKQTINELHKLITAELEAESKAFSPYSMGVGPARFDRQKMVNANDKAIKARSAVDSFMSEQRNKQQHKEYKRQQDAEINAMRTASQQGKLTVKVNGKEYFRTTKTSSTWREGSLVEYKARQKFEKTQKDLPFNQRKYWDNLSADEKKKRMSEIKIK